MSDFPAVFPDEDINLTVKAIRYDKKVSVGQNIENPLFRDIDPGIFIGRGKGDYEMALPCVVDSERGEPSEHQFVP